MAKACYPAPPGDACEQANAYVVPAYNIMAYLRARFDEVPNTAMGWLTAITQTEYNFGLGACFINNAVTRINDPAIRADWYATTIPEYEDPPTIFTQIGCACFQTLTENTILDYTALQAEFVALGLPGLGAMLTSIPRHILNKKALYFATSVDQSYGFITAIDCGDC